MREATMVMAKKQVKPGYFVNHKSLAFRLKVRWFKDILAHTSARQFLWSLYYAGEAYVELHPQGVFIDRLEPLLAHQLERHLADETRHAKLFAALLAKEESAPIPLSEKEDVGWYLLHNIFPVGKLNNGKKFTLQETLQYMAFLHMLELRSISDLAALITAAHESGAVELASELERIIKDERFHASYTHRAVMRLAENKQEAYALLDRTRRAEKKYYAICMQHILQRFETLGAIPQTGWGGLRWYVMRMLAQREWAFPLLPCYIALPTQIMSKEK